MVRRTEGGRRRQAPAPTDRSVDGRPTQCALRTGPTGAKVLPPGRDVCWLGMLHDLGVIVLLLGEDSSSGGGCWWMAGRNGGLHTYIQELVLRTIPSSSLVICTDKK